MDNKQFLDYLYNKYIITEELTKKLRKKMIFARAHLCSSSLLGWGTRKEFIDEKKRKKIRELLTNSPDGIDNYYVKNFGDGSMNHLTERRKEASEKQLKELIGLIQKTEKFIKEDLEKETNFEGEFEEKFPQYIKDEEENWEHYEIENKNI